VSERPRAPRWFSGAIATAPTEGTVDVEGCPIHYLEWGDRTLPGLLLVHGGAAHAHWWSFIAPQLTHQYHVAAVDMSGHGDSGWRDRYGPELWGEEVMAVAEHTGMCVDGAKPILVGHSMGGFVSIVTASIHGEELAGTIVVDSPVRRPDPETEEGDRGRAFRNPKRYPDLDTAVEHFHLVPPQPCDNDFIVDHIARHSLRETDGGWTWKFDPGLWPKREMRQDVIGDHLASVKCRIAVFHGQFSALVTPDISDYMNELLGRNAPFVEIPQAHHHLLLDQPLAFIAALRAILADWEHSVPLRKQG
jgi:pimeloyl-ACP methyl ester carboxylesterase